MVRIISAITLMMILSACDQEIWRNGNVEFVIEVDDNRNVTFGIEGSIGVGLIGRFVCRFTLIRNKEGT